MCGAIPPLPHCISIVWCLIKQEIYLYGMVLSYTQGELYLCLTAQGPVFGSNLTWKGPVNMCLEVNHHEVTVLLRINGRSAAVHTTEPVIAG